jgi:AcrR family transcriptional regulator
VETGLGIVDGEGLDALSMRRVAQELGTGSASLYAYVASKEELLELIYERVVGEVPVPVPDPARWQEQLREIALDSARVLMAHSDIARVGLANVPTGPSTLRITEGMLAIMVAGGVPLPVASLAVDRLQLYITSATLEAALFQAMQRASGKDIGEFIEGFFGQLRDYLGSLPRDRFPIIAAHADELTAADGQERYEFGLDLLIESIARRAHRTEPRRTDPPADTTRP